MLVRRWVAAIASALVLLSATAGSAAAETPVDIPDPGLHRCVTDALKLPPGSTPTTDQLNGLTNLTCFGSYTDAGTG